MIITENDPAAVVLRCVTPRVTPSPLIPSSIMFQFYEIKLVFLWKLFKIVVAKLNELSVQPAVRNLQLYLLPLVYRLVKSSPFALCSEHICVQAAKRMQSRVALALLLSVCPRQLILAVSSMCLGGRGGFTPGLSKPAAVDPIAQDRRLDPSAKRLRPALKNSTKAHGPANHLQNPTHCPATGLI